MYSVVLMAALTTGADAPSWGCHGCWGGRWGCRGCYGCNGCYGGCYGCNGCYGGWGCCGGYRSYGWSGCYGGCYGCYGGCNGGVVTRPTQPIRGRGGYAEPIPAPPGDKQKKPAEKDSKPKEKEETSLDTQAKLIVELPSDAKLYIDNKLMQSTAARRVFATPRLEPGRKYYYVLRAEVVRDGKPLSDTKQVIFQAGDEIRESFAKLAPPGPADKVTAKAEE